ncbi:MAG TPA: hypothetical protein PLR28_09820 [Dokdonella sp.]|uniref:hypothetical protein n=1 Tax=Dokdonella sp. TaxID=2291710 RepID=UPI002D0D1B1D|nr:hypothetical protein [Dokdonella sp.]HOX72906.1 hypothetical protein [Dokdonella sp.]HPG94838.1 hypothetical protein [Dokdonella sp.]HPN79132.1 hypothetical protein [Dokdonella sp.]
MAKRHVRSPARKPCQEAPIRPLPSRAQAAAIVIRNLIPLAGIVVLGWLAGQFLILSVFSLALSIVGIGTTGVMVSTRKQMPDARLSDQISSGVIAIGLTLFGSVILTALFGWVIAVFAVNIGESLFDGALLGSALLVVISAAPAMVRQYREDLASSLTEEQRKQRDQPTVFGLVLSAGLIFVLSGYAPGFGRFGLVALAFAVTALFIFRDLRPDLVRSLAARGPQVPPGG